MLPKEAVRPLHGGEQEFASAPSHEGDPEQKIEEESCAYDELHAGRYVSSVASYKRFHASQSLSVRKTNLKN